MNTVELENTYLAAALPDDLASYDSMIIADVYYPTTVPHPNLRFRQRGEHYEVTKKDMIDGTDSSQMLEQTIQLTPDEFQNITANGGRRVVKRRYKYPWNGHIAEIDVFEEDLKGLVVVDFEFDTREKQLAFAPPDFCLVEVTQDPDVAGGVLAGKKYEDVAVYLDSKNYKPLKLKEVAA